MNFDNYQAVVVARNLESNLNNSYAQTLNSCLTGISAAINQENLPFIGHVKISAQDREDNLFYLSITVANTPAETTGELLVLEEPISIRINAILYGIDEELLAKIIDKNIDIFLRAK